MKIWVIAAIVGVVIIVIAVVVTMATASKSTTRVSTQKINSLVEQCQHWNATSHAAQDPNTAFMYSSYAMAFAAAALQLLTQKELNQTTKKDVGTLFENIKKQHTDVISQLNATEVSPKIDPNLALIIPVL